MTRLRAGGSSTLPCDCRPFPKRKAAEGEGARCVDMRPLPLPAIRGALRTGDVTQVRCSI